MKQTKLRTISVSRNDNISFPIGTILAVQEYYQKIDFFYERNIGLSIGGVNSVIIYIMLYILVLFLLIFITPAIGTYSGKRAAGIRVL